jgi:ABC-2 type transport system ATP-binding protein
MALGSSGKGLARQQPLDPGILAIEAVGLTKWFGATAALDGLDLSVMAGTVHGILGPNGAGKTTTIRILSTLVTPDAGRAWVFGCDTVTQARQARERLAMTGQFASLDDDLTGTENLVLLGRLNGLPRRASRSRADELLKTFALEGSASRQVKTYSGGMRRRFDLAASLLVTPELLFLDEPTTGLDPASRADVWHLIRAMVADGTTVLLTTQNLDEADQLAGRITVIDRGAVIAQGSPDELKASVGGGTLLARLAEPSDRPEAKRILGRILEAPVQDGDSPNALSARVRPRPSMSSPAERAAQAITELASAGIAVREFSLGQPSLDEVYLSLTGHPGTTANTISDEEFS